MEHGGDINHQDHNGNTALMDKLTAGALISEDAITELVHAGTNLNLKNKDGKTALKILEEQKNKLSTEKYEKLYNLLTPSSRQQKTKSTKPSRKSGSRNRSRLSLSLSKDGIRVDEPTDPQEIIGAGMYSRRNDLT